MSYFAGLQEDYLHARAWWGEKLATSGPPGEDATSQAFEEIDRARRMAIDWGLELIHRDQSDPMSGKVLIDGEPLDALPLDQSGAQGISEAICGEFWSAVLQNIALENGRPKQGASESSRRRARFERFPNALRTPGPILNERDQQKPCAEAEA